MVKTMQSKSLLQHIILWVSVVALVIFSLFPIVQLLSVSLKPQKEWGEAHLIPKQITWVHYKEVLGLGQKGAQLRLSAWENQMNISEAQSLPPELKEELTQKVEAWVEKSDDAYEYLGDFKSYYKSYQKITDDVKSSLIQAGLSSAAANAMAQKGIVTSVDSKILPVLARLDDKAEKQEEILKKYVKSGFNFMRFFRNSFIFSTVSSLIAVFLAIFGAYALARLKFFGQATLSKAVLLTYMVGGILLLVPLFQMAAQIGLLSSPLKRAIFLMAIYIMQTLPVSLYMLGNYFRTISFSLEEAAAIDGYGRLEIIAKIILPLSLPMVATVFVYCFIIAWNEYLFVSSFLKESQGFWTFPIALKSLTTSANDIKGIVSAASLLTLVPVIFLFSFVIRHVTGGLSDGGVKE